MLKFWDLVSYFEDSALADNIRENDLLFPLIESVHVLSICLVVGSILVVDLRLLGLASIYEATKPTADSEYWWKIDEPNLLSQFDPES